MDSGKIKVEAARIPLCKEVTCIIPVRLGKDRGDALERLGFFRLDTRLPDSFGFVVVDDGSAPDDGLKIRAACEQLGIGHIRIESGSMDFAVGRCRNVGAMYARSRYVLMQDVDLMPYPGFYQGLLDEMQVQGLGDDAKKFLMVPCVSLTEAGTRQFFSTEPEIRSRKFLHCAWIKDESIIEKVSSGTSANLYNRLWFLSRGGNSEEFEGWGYEDYEFNTRAILHLNYFPVPADWLLQKYNFGSVLEYRTWRAVYRLFGDMLFYKGSAYFHAWHPIMPRGDYMRRKRRNWETFRRKMRQFVTSGAEPDALPDLSRGRSLLLSRNAFTFSREIRPLLGEVIMADDHLLEGKVDAVRFVKEHGVERVVFHNPFRDEPTLALYTRIRAAGVPFIVCERGALPGSCFFDSTGFLVDGTTYERGRWDKPLSEEARERTLEYIRRLRDGNDALEPQSARLGKDGARRKLGLRDHEKVLFVALQRPGDTVTRYFTGELGAYPEFLKLVTRLSSGMPEGWRLVVKRHPLEEVDVTLAGDSCCANDVNIRDLLDVADALLTFNSGVGVMAMAWGIPAMVAGHAFYEFDRVNAKVAAVEDVLGFLGRPLSPDPETVLRFYSYLIDEVYSFGVFDTKPVKTLDGENMTATMDIRYRELRWPGEEPVYYSSNHEPVVPFDALLFDRYRNGGVRFADLDADRVGNMLPFRSVESINRGERTRRKWEKFRKSPRRFLMDSRLRPLRMIGKLLPKKRPG